MSDSRPLTGPRGGHTTRKAGQVKKTVWLNDDEAEALRKTAYETRTSEAEIIRLAVRRHLALSE